MNKPIRRLSLFLMVLFGVLLLNVNYIQAIQADDLRADPANSRQIARQLNMERGPILASDGEPVAFSEATEGDDAAYNYRRVYPDSEYFAHLTGYMTMGSRTGIEAAENSLLDGSDSRLLVRNFIDTLTGVEEQGASVQLTVDPDAQQAALDGLREQGSAGAAVALDPATGAVLASASLPTFDINDLVTDTGGHNEEFFQEEIRAEEANQPDLFRALNERYPPGSTFKVVTSAAALENGFSPGDTLEGPAELELPQGGPALPNAFSGPCDGGNPTLAKSLEISCNTSYGSLALDLGAEVMFDQASAFGFNQESMNIPLPVTESLYPDESDNPNALVSSGIGQGNIESTPLQMAMVAAGVANGGDVMEPYLVDEVRGPDLSEIVSASPRVHSTAVSGGTASDLTDMMVLVTEGPDATGTTAQIPGMQVAGKTGTAQAGEGRENHAWFISFAPADDPQVAVAVVIEHGGGSGGQNAAPVARGIMEAVLQE
jgi:penicillin-binding protein A